MNWKQLAVLLGAALCGPARADDLATIYREALATNAQYDAAKAQYAAIRERVPEAVSGLLPSVSVSANSLWNDNNSNTLQRQQYNSNGYSVTLTQPLWRTQNWLALRQARSQVVQAKAQLDLAQEELLIRTAQAYFDVLYAEDASNAVKEQHRANFELLQQAKRNFEVGGAPITDVRDAEAREALVGAQEISARNDVASKTQVLRQLISRDPGPLARLRSGVQLTSPVPNAGAPWEQAAETANAAVMAAEAALEVAQGETSRTRAGRLPTIDLVATHGVTKSATDITVGTDLHADTIGVQLSLPIYAGGGPSAKIRESLALVHKATADLNDARRTSVLAAEQAYLGATSGLAQVKAFERAFAASQVALEANKRGVEAGNRINLDVLDAQQQLAQTQRDLAKARYDTILALLRLKAAAGSLSDADIDEVNTLLER